MQKFFFVTLFFTPLFWFNEFFQNLLFFSITGYWGWIYPVSPYHWFNFFNLINWGIGIMILQAIYKLLFIPKNPSFFFRILIITALGWLVEWGSNFLISVALGKPFIIWPHSSLVYISYSAIPLWIWNAFLFEGLYRWFSSRLK